MNHDREADDEEESYVAPTKKDFHHPYVPYDIQETFMSTVYQVIEDGKVGILESPTGTGKSLSLICGSLSWLRDYKGKTFKDGLNWGCNEPDEPVWIVDQARARKKQEWLRQREDLEAGLARVRAKEKVLNEKYVKGDQRFKKRKTNNQAVGDIPEEEQFVLDDYDSDVQQAHSVTGASSEFSKATLELMSKLGMIMTSSNDGDEETPDEMKIFYCSRTHSQLTQFINELRRVRFPPAIAAEQPSLESQAEDVKHLTLGSRKNLCINSSVNTLGSLDAINERCVELQQPSTVQEHKCPFLPSKDNQPLVNKFRDHALATIRDIEDMGSLGKAIGICPYYSSRSAIKSAEIVTLPYPLLLQKSAREALSLSLKGHVVIIDEAHNLMDAISSMYGTIVTLKQLRLARMQLGAYLQKFRNRLKGKNRIYIAQVVRVVDSLVGYLESKLLLSKVDGIVSEKELLNGKGVDQINLFKLIRYLQESKLARKVESYTIHMETSSSQALTLRSKTASSTPVLHHISALLHALTHPSHEGRLFFSKSETPITPDLIALKFQLLDPSTHFQEIVTEARAVILAGGTMSPMTDYITHLFPHLSLDRITMLSCGHVVPKENLVAWNISKGPSAQTLEFTFKNRDNIDMIDELGRALLNICTVVPDGIVMFFPSYNYLEMIVKRWEVPSQSDGTKTIWQRLEDKKVLFRESKDAGVEVVLAQYASAIDAGKGGLLLSVVGGKMSEGINFSDRLGRCVVIVGLPFPNIMSAEWKAKIEYIESTTISRLEAANSVSNASSDLPRTKMSREDMLRKAKEQGREFYENACMRAVNQSVGRAIRHRGDYAAILMIDRRFEGVSVRQKLPGWIKEGLVEGADQKGFGALMGVLGNFFRVKKGT